MFFSEDDFVCVSGRRIYGNIQKFVCFLLGTNIGEIMYLTIAIAGNNFNTQLMPSITLESI